MAALALALVAVSQRPLVAQAEAGPSPSRVFVEWRPPLTPESLEPQQALQSLNAGLRREARKSRWLEGGLIGAGVLGLGAAVVAASMCNDDAGTNDCTWPVIGSAVVGAGVGMVVGSLIGGTIKKEPSAVGS